MRLTLAQMLLRRMLCVLDARSRVCTWRVDLGPELMLSLTAPRRRRRRCVVVRPHAARGAARARQPATRTLARGHLSPVKKRGFV